MQAAFTEESALRKAARLHQVSNALDTLQNTLVMVLWMYICGLCDCTSVNQSACRGDSAFFN